MRTGDPPRMPPAALQQRLGKKTPFASPEQEASIGILYVADRIENRLGRLLREFELTNSQYNVLRILRGEGKPLPALEIARRMIQVAPAITGLIDRLEKQKLVARRRCEEDRRVVYIEATKKGLAVLGKIDAPLSALHKELLGGMSMKDLAVLRGLLDKAVKSVAAE